MGLSYKCKNPDLNILDDDGGTSDEMIYSGNIISSLYILFKLAPQTKKFKVIQELFCWGGQNYDKQ